RALVWESSAVAEAAMKSGVAGKTIALGEYRERLGERIGLSRAVMRPVVRYAKSGQAHCRVFRR
ncbi:MAG: hypothetical protein IH914_09510, partial [candidate division Zixibacteria bacterium]|nr:hypothetical protein [candidate division Zixibacteria bacterium]